MSRDPQTPPGGSRQSEPPRNLDEALAALQAEREKRVAFHDLFVNARFDRNTWQERAEQAERRLDEAVEALREIRSDPEVRRIVGQFPEGLLGHVDEIARVALASIEAQPERGAEGEAPSTERTARAALNPDPPDSGAKAP